MMRIIACNILSCLGVQLQHCKAQPLVVMVVDLGCATWASWPNG